MPRGANIDVLLLRSGRTDWDDQGRIQGRTDLPLSVPGRRAVESQIRRAVEAVAGNPPAVVYCGPDDASRETARLVAEATDARLKVEDDLITMDLGLWEGMLESEVEARYPSACRMWRDEPRQVHPPKGESFEDADQRTRLAIARLLDKANGKAVAFVLRPLPFAMASCWLAQDCPKCIWTVLKEGPEFRRLLIRRQTIREVLQGLKAGA